MLTDVMWSKLSTILLEYRVYNQLAHQYTMEEILYRLPVGRPW